MKKNFLQDVIPSSHKRSIRDIPLPTHKNSEPSIKKPIRQKIKEVQEEYDEPLMSSKEEEKEEYEEEVYTEIKPKVSKKKKQGSVSKKLFVGVLVGFILFLGIFISRTNATITITPKKITQDINIVIPLDTSNTLATKTQISKSASKTLPATGEQQVEKQASGKIKIINKHKEVSQELVKNTRFQTPNGLIYRIQESIEIPGYTMNGSTLVPGTLEVEVFADSAGEEYNVSNVKFTIPGFSGKEQFDKITAESVGEISGGSIGVRKVVSEEAKEQVQKDLEAQLKTEIESTKNESTEYVIVSNLETLSYGEIQDKVEGDSVVLSLTAKVDAYSFVKKDFSNFVGQNSIQGASTTDLFSVNTTNLLFGIDKEEIRVTGSTLITYITDIEKLKKDFSGKKRSAASSIIDSYNSLEGAVATLKPFWKSKFPSDPSKIEVIINE